MTAETHGARVVVPTQSKIIHPPDLWLAINSGVDADESQVGEVVIKIDEGEIAITGNNVSTSRHNLCLSRNEDFISRRVKSVSSKGKVAARTS